MSLLARAAARYAAETGTSTTIVVGELPARVLSSWHICPCDEESCKRMPMRWPFLGKLPKRRRRAKP